MKTLLFVVLAVLSAPSVSACTRTHNLAQSADRDGGPARIDAGRGSDAQAADAGPYFMDDASPQLCNGHVCQCSNGISDDEDELIDGEDPECTGPADDIEANFATRLDDDRENAKCQDCYFDTVPGNDVCNRPSSCAMSGAPSGGTGACRVCEVSDSCAASCERLAPNGCDCFGCCEVWNKGQKLNILLRASCRMDRLTDETACPRCEQAPDCLNECSECERCPGKLVSDLPRASCSGPPSFQCDDGKTCSANGDCARGTYCSQGCCLPTAIGF